MKDPELISDAELSARYQRETQASPPELDRRVLEAARQRAPQAAPRGWNWSPALSAVAALGLIAVFLPDLLRDTPAEFVPLAEEPAPRAQAAPAAALSDSSTSDDEIGISKPMRPAQPQLSADAMLVEESQAMREVAKSARYQQAPAAGSAVATAADVAAVEPPLTAAEWLKKIEGLVQAGELAAARRSYEEYRKAYPDLPEDGDLLDSLGIRP